MARTRQRILDEAERLFRARGYAATSLEEIAEAANVTKGAIYGHFSSKEDLLMSAVEATPTPDYGALLNDQGRPLIERLAEFGRTMAVDEATTDKPRLALSLEFVAALLRSPDALHRYGTTTAEAWAIGYALVLGLQIYQCLTPGILTPAVFERAYTLLAGLYPEP
jgi:AcrR family transcriptional regulator